MQITPIKFTFKVRTKLVSLTNIAKRIPGARDQDDRMAKARRKLDWDAQWLEALDPETAKAIRESRMPEEDHSDTCSMCGKFCAVRSMNKALSGEVIDIL